MNSTLTVNQRRQPVAAEPETPLLWVLREELGLTGTKFGCGIAQCGACTVHLDGRDADIDAAITNLCRCGTYPRVREAIHHAARELAAGAPA